MLHLLVLTSRDSGETEARTLTQEVHRSDGQACWEVREAGLLQTTGTHSGGHRVVPWRRAGGSRRGDRQRRGAGTAAP